MNVIFWIQVDCFVSIYGNFSSKNDLVVDNEIDKSSEKQRNQVAHEHVLFCNKVGKKQESHLEQENTRA